MKTNTNTNNDERVKALAFKLAREALVSGAWPTMNQALGIVGRTTRTAKTLAQQLAEGGCLGDEYGENGSLEIELAEGLLRFPTPSAVENASAKDVFALALHLRDIGALTDAEIKRSQAVKIEAKDKAERELAERKAEEERTRLENARRAKLEEERANVRAKLEEELENVKRLRMETISKGGNK